ncbi:Astacin-like metalloendopeptidase [Aphelenchoides fujianensis]|nr:Astacin-like metalloendopeptidase [Aphelenchoides fujianensis]
MSGVCLIVFVFLFLVPQVRSENLIAADDLGDLAEVRSLLSKIRIASFRSRVPAGEFHDYDPNVTKNEVMQANFDEGTEASVNRRYIEDLFENDILLTVPQARDILQEVQNPSSKSKRQAQPGEKYYWKTNVSFRFYWSDSDWQKLIHEAHRHIESETCIRFIENGTDKDYLLYTRGSGCWSSVGRTGGRQQISIGYGCDAMGIVAHETFHALGLWHEQSRTDRDDYVSIAWKNIFRGTESNFEKRTPKNSENYGLPYDLGSVLHYGAKAFSTDWESYSILTKDANYQQTIGQRLSVSFKDAKIINMRYCSDVCPKQLACLNAGYTDPNDCDRCKCPDGFGGTLCQAVPASNIAACRGGELTASTQLRELNSPPVDPGARCYWRLKAKRGQQIRLNVSSVSFLCDNACSSYVEVKYKKQKQTTGARFCCEAPKQPIVSENEEVLIIFRGASDIVKGWLGFQLTYQAVDSNERSSTTVDHHEETTTPTETETTTNEPPTSTSTTSTTTTEAPTSSTRPAAWSEWGGWSGCTVTCGGCGRRKRVRACYGGDRKCEGDHQEFGTCGEQSCSFRQRTTRCDGRLILPCDLLERLDFGTTRLPSSAKIEDLPKRTARSALMRSLGNQVAAMDDEKSGEEEAVFLPMTPRNARVLSEIHREHAARKRRFVDGDKQLEMKIYCENYSLRKFTYNCPTNLLTVSMDWKEAKDTIMPADSRLCCQGFTSRAGRCVKD